MEYIALIISGISLVLSIVVFCITIIRTKKDVFKMPDVKLTEQDITGFIENYDKMIKAIISDNRNSTPEEIISIIISEIETDLLSKSGADSHDFLIIQDQRLYNKLKGIVKSRLKQPVSNEEKIDSKLQFKTNNMIKETSGQGTHLINLFENSDINEM